MNAIDTRAFRSALGTFVTGVTVVTALDPQGARVGLTANSFNSVSLDPPMVLWSLALDSSNLEAFRRARRWAVHVLAVGQEALSAHFARKTGDKFDGVVTQPGPDGVPLLAGCAARFICRTAFEYEGGDHAIFVGEVTAFERFDAEPLAYHAGRYARVTQHDTDRLGALEAQGYVETGPEGLALTESGRLAAAELAALAVAGSGWDEKEAAPAWALLRQLFGSSIG